MKPTLKTACVFVISLLAPVVRAEPIPFENYATFEGVEFTPLAVRFQNEFAVGPFSWFSSSGALELPGYDSNVTSVIDIRVTSLPVIDPVNMVLTVSGDFEQTLEAHNSDGSITGTMTLVGTGDDAFDLNPDTINVDPIAGTITRRFGSPFLDDGPVVRVALIEATGIFEGIRAVDEWELFISAQQIIPIVPGLELIDNLFVTPIAASGQLITVGLYVPEPSSWLLAVVASILLPTFAWRRRRMPRVGRWG